MKRVEHVDLQEELVADVIPVKRHTLDEGDVRHELGLAIVHIAAVADGQSIVNRQMNLVNMRVHYLKSAM